jgi:hypothetical protein
MGEAVRVAQRHAGLCGSSADSLSFIGCGHLFRHAGSLLPACRAGARRFGSGSRLNGFKGLCIPELCWSMPVMGYLEPPSVASNHRASLIRQADSVITSCLYRGSSNVPCQLTFELGTIVYFVFPAKSSTLPSSLLRRGMVCHESSSERNWQNPNLVAKAPNWVAVQNARLPGRSLRLCTRS